jgi:transketolase
LTNGPIAAACLQAAESLFEQAIHAAVVSVPCVKPLDELFVARIAANARLIVTVEEHILRGGLYSAVSAAIVGESRHPPLLGLAVPEQSGKISVAGDRDALLSAAGLSSESIAGRIRQKLGLETSGQEQLA